MAQPPRGVQPAGLLPYYPARFVSQAEQAAERLPEQIKSQSLKNALLRQGAKPVELEYAGLDDFVSKQAGGMARREDVLDFLKQQGPLGQLKRVEQQVVGGEAHAAGLEGPQYAPSVRSPFDASTASGQTMYHNYTVPGKQGDFTGYREVLLEDPRNRPKGKSLIDSQRSPLADFPDAEGWRDRATERLRQLEGGDFVDFEAAERESARLHAMAADRGMRLVRDADGNPRFEFETNTDPVNAHSSDYWARYNEFPDRIAVQNIQSDVGQDASKGRLRPPDETADGVNAHLAELFRMEEQIQERIARNPDYQHNDTDLREVNEAIQDVLDGHGDELDLVTGPDGRPMFVDPPVDKRARSTLARDDNWKNLMARHIALQSIAGGGKPITIPTGKQMVDVEGFGGNTYDLDTPEGRASAEQSGAAYNEDLVRRLQKIFRGLDPSGASVQARQARRYLGPPPITGLSKSAADREAQDFHASLRQPLEDIHRSQVEAIWSDRANAGEYLPRRAIEREVVSSRLPHEDRAVYNALRHGDISALQRAVSGQQTPSAPYLDAAMKAIQRNAALQEMGDPGVVAGRPGLPDLPLADGPTADPRAPGWTIKPSPEAVRAALERGLPIMSILAPLLLAPSQEDR